MCIELITQNGVLHQKFGQYAITKSVKVVEFESFEIRVLLSLVSSQTAGQKSNKLFEEASSCGAFLDSDEI